MTLLGRGFGASALAQDLLQESPDEGHCIKWAMERLAPFSPLRDKASQRAVDWIKGIRQAGPALMSLENVLHELPLNSAGGRALMQLSECLLRTPDAHTRALLLSDLLGAVDWKSQTQGSKWGRWLAPVLEAVAAIEKHQAQGNSSWLEKLADPVLQRITEKSIQKLGSQFLLAEDIGEALTSRAAAENPCSFDMLGEGARTQADAQKYFAAYWRAADRLAASRSGAPTPHSLSIKLSALSPRFTEKHRDQCVPELIERVSELALKALPAGIAVTLDAEENHRLILTLEVLEGVVKALQQHQQGKPTINIQGLGVAVQAYNRRALPVIQHLIDWARDHYAGLQIRLVKGAYWDTEIARAQTMGLADFPVFTSKQATDLNYLACAAALLEARPMVYPMLATHNAASLAWVFELASNTGTASFDDFECQRLYGMGSALWQQVGRATSHPLPVCRIYAPVGTQAVALAYLVRRLLENGANSSFVNEVLDPAIPVDRLAESPMALFASRMYAPLPGPRTGAQLFSQRKNSPGLNLDSRETRHWLAEILKEEKASSCPHSKTQGQASQQTTEPLLDERSSKSVTATPAADTETLRKLSVSQKRWASKSANERADKLEAWADQLIQHKGELIVLLMREAGKTAEDAVAEWREAIDFLFHYSAQGRRLLAQPQSLPGPAGEYNSLRLTPKGLCVCISPWNFPLAIFTGQIAACLMGGNAVAFKAAPQTQGIASKAIELAVKAGLPADLLCALGTGDEWVKRVIADWPIQAVFFTGSTATARSIQQSLSNRSGPLIPLTAETGGVNAMIVDSTALLEQACDAILQSAFGSAGQRCSALRVVYVQKEISPQLKEMVHGALALLIQDQTVNLQSDLGPLIDESQVRHLQKGLSKLGGIEPEILNERLLNDRCFPPTVVDRQTADLSEEWFGPLLQWVEFDAREFEQVLTEIANSGWGLTFGLHSRLLSRIQQVQTLPIGNLYINRAMTGAIVGSQPFGGQGLSGTGPKAGGLYTLLRTVNEQALSDNRACAGGIPELFGSLAHQDKLPPPGNQQR